MKKVGSNKIVIIHHQPLEAFPPVMNFINYLLTRARKEDRTYVITSIGDLGFKKFENPGVTISRIYKVNKSGGRTRLLYNYFLFTVASLYNLLRWQPDAILYYESHSALPVFLYYRFFNPSAKLFIHYHEYMTPAEYSQKGMRLVNYAHTKESYLYRIASWISHTNSKRMELFMSDHPFIQSKAAHVVPNYPPIKWAENAVLSDNIAMPVKLVYLGSFGSPEDLYIKEILSWAKGRPSEVILDIYSFNASAEVKDFLSELKASNIRLLDAVDYDSIPTVLPGYDVGLILYKATSLNFKFNAPNKLFEYLARGLDVWFPKEMLGCYPYKTAGVYPKVIDVDFKNLDHFNFEGAISRQGLVPTKNDFFCETAYALFVDKLQE